MLLSDRFGLSPLVLFILIGGQISHASCVLLPSGDRARRIRRGAPRAEEGHGPRVRHEDPPQTGHAAEGAGIASPLLLSTPLHS